MLDWQQTAWFKQRATEIATQPTVVLKAGSAGFREPWHALVLGLGRTTWTMTSPLCLQGLYTPLTSSSISPATSHRDSVGHPLYRNNSTLSATWMPHSIPMVSSHSPSSRKTRGQARQDPGHSRQSMQANAGRSRTTSWFIPSPMTSRQDPGPYCLHSLCASTGSSQAACLYSLLRMPSSKTTVGRQKTSPSSHMRKYSRSSLP